MNKIVYSVDDGLTFHDSVMKRHLKSCANCNNEFYAITDKEKYCCYSCHSRSKSRREMQRRKTSVKALYYHKIYNLLNNSKRYEDLEVFKTNYRVVKQKLTEEELENWLKNQFKESHKRGIK